MFSQLCAGRGPLLLGQQLHSHDVAVQGPIHGCTPGQQNVLADALRAHVALVWVEAIDPKRPLRAIKSLITQRDSIMQPSCTELCDTR